MTGIHHQPPDHPRQALAGQFVVGDALRRPVRHQFLGIPVLVIVSRMGIGDPRIGEYYMLSSITPVVVGGTILAGGKGGVLGTLIGVYLIILIRNLLNFMDITSFYQWIIILIRSTSYYVMQAF